MLATFLDLYIASIAVSSAYNKIRETYRYDYRVNQLLMYLKHHDLSSTLLDAIKSYTTRLWQRQKGKLVFLQRFRPQHPRLIKSMYPC